MQLLPKGTNLHEIIHLPYYNYLAYKARKDDMVIERHPYGKHKRQYLLHFTPKGGPSKKEVIIYFHGGGWTFGSPEMFRSNAQLFVDLGYSVVMPSYRRLPVYRAADMANDGRLALQETIALLEQKGFSNLRFFIGGMSSGAHLAALLTYDRASWDTIAFRKKMLAGIFLFGPPLDLASMAWSPVIQRLAGRQNKAYFKKANPLEYLQEGEDVSTIIVHGTLDGLVNYKSTESFVKKRGSKNLKLFTIDKGTHLDAAFWVFRDNEIRKVILTWFAQQSSAIYSSDA